MRFKAPTGDEGGKLLYFDIESQQNTGIHMANLVKVQTSCDECEGPDDDLCR